MCKRAPNPAAAGFTLVEMLVAVTIGAFGIAAAAAVARTAVQQSGRGRQVNMLHSTSRLVIRQLRADLDVAGLGSTGAVAADCSGATWGAICGPTPGAGFSAIPAIRGANNVAGSVGGINVRAGSDALQLIVPDPSTRATTTRPAATNSSIVYVPPMPCRMLYVSDHSAPNGAGRTQVIVMGARNVRNPSSAERLQFPVFEGSDVMCARLTTYWVDEDGWLYRSDAIPGTGPAGTLGVLSVPTTAPANRVAPGVEDLQIAYRFSSELTGNRLAPPPDRWAYDDDPGGTAVEAAIAASPAAAWFEVRQVRISMLTRSLRAVGEPGAILAEAALEDRPDDIDLRQGYARSVIRSSAVIRTLRYYDMSSPGGLNAEPY